MELANWILYGAVVLWTGVAVAGSIDMWKQIKGKK